MYYYNNDYTDLQFLYIDILILFPICFFMAVTSPAKKLTHHIPVRSLLSAPIVLSITGQSLINMGCLFGMLALIKHKDWYFPIYLHVVEDVDVSYENSTLFLFSNIQYISTMFSYNIAKPYMSPIYTNLILSVWVSVSVCISYYLIFCPNDFTMGLLDLVYLPLEFRYELALGTIVNFVLSYMYEKILMQSFADYWQKRKKHPKGYT